MMFNYKIQLKIYLKSILFCTILIAGWPIGNAADEKIWRVKAAEEAEIIIEDKVIRSTIPSSLFGFNINFVQFQKQIWDQVNLEPKGNILKYLKPFNDAVYRYPGGLVSNTFHWEGAVGAIEDRFPQSSFYILKPKKVLFGIDEYLNLVDQVAGVPLYVLNIVGSNPTEPMQLTDVNEVALKNLGVATYLNERIDTSSASLFLELGNELDRSRYEWTPEQYAERALTSIEAIQKEHDNVEFVPALRDFKTKSKKGDKNFLPDPQEWIETIARELPMTKGYSLHHYYDADRPDKKSRSIPFWMTLMAQSIEHYENATGRSPEIWITEHGRQGMTDNPGKDNSKMSTSNLGAAISTADYMIALSLFPEVKGAVWHGLNAGPWQLFDYSAKFKDLRPRPIYWAFRVMFDMHLDVGLTTYTRSPNLSEYKGGYDVRAAAFRNQQADELGVRAINRYRHSQTVRLSYKPFAGKEIELKHFSLSGEPGVSPEDELHGYKLELEPIIKTGRFSDTGEFMIDLPSSSVSTILIKLK